MKGGDRRVKKERLTDDPMYQRKYNIKQRKLCQKELGGKCVCCGETYWAYLEIDHVNDDGKLHRDSKGKDHVFSTVYKLVEALDEGYQLQLLCGNCHLAKTSRVPCNHHLTWGQRLKALFLGHV